jgi:hypothetical protein
MGRGRAVGGPWEGRGGAVEGPWGGPYCDKVGAAVLVLVVTQFVWVEHGLLGGVVGAAGAVEVH